MSTSTHHDYSLLIHACENGDVARVKTLVGGDTPAAQYAYALDSAAHRGQVDIVRCLLPVCEQRYIDGVLINACVQGHTHVVECLVQAKALKHYNAPLQWAAKYGHAAIVEILIPVSNPQVNNSLALLWAVQHNHPHVVQQLVAHSDCHKVLKELKRNGVETIVLENEMQKHRLLQNVKIIEKPVAQRKM